MMVIVTQLFAIVRKEIQDETDRITGRTKMISPVPIHLIVNLTLIDLPGLTKVVVEGQSETIVEEIENMVRSYVEKVIQSSVLPEMFKSTYEAITKGSEIYQEMLSNVLARYYGAKLLIFDNYSFLGFPGHRSAVRGLTVSTDGRILVSCGSDSSVKLWSVPDDTVMETESSSDNSPKIEYDPRVINFRQLLEVFWSNHDSQQVFGQRPDVGNQYQVYYH